MPDGAMGAVAADQPGRLDRFFPTVLVPEGRSNPIGILREAGKLDLALHRAAQRDKVLVQQPLGMTLRDHQGEVVRA